MKMIFRIAVARSHCLRQFMSMSTAFSFHIESRYRFPSGLYYSRWIRLEKTMSNQTNTAKFGSISGLHLD